MGNNFSNPFAQGGVAPSGQVQFVGRPANGYMIPSPNRYLEETQAAQPYGLKGWYLRTLNMSSAQWLATDAGTAMNLLRSNFAYSAAHVGVGSLFAQISDWARANPGYFPASQALSNSFRK